MAKAGRYISSQIKTCLTSLLKHTISMEVVAITEGVMVVLEEQAKIYTFGYVVHRLAFVSDVLVFIYI